MSGSEKITEEPAAEQPKEEQAKDEPKPAWEYKTEFGINARMREVCEASIKLAQAEIERYKRKLARLTYGS